MQLGLLIAVLVGEALVATPQLGHWLMLMVVMLMVMEFVKIMNQLTVLVHGQIMEIVVKLVVVVLKPLHIQ